MYVVKLPVMLPVILNKLDIIKEALKNNDIQTLKNEFIESTNRREKIL